MFTAIVSASVFAALFSSTNAAAIKARGHDETITLSNCKNGDGVYSSQMGYYPGSPQFPNEQPTIAVVQTGSTVVWEGNTVVGTFPDSNTFTTQLGPKGPDQSLAGMGANKQRSDWYCRHHAQAGIYTDPQGSVCNMIYYCNHYSPANVVSPPPPTTVPSAQGTVKFDFHIQGNYATMPGHWEAADMMASIDKAVGDPYCDNTKSIQIGDGSCVIVYNCHGDVPGQTTKGMAQMLKSVVAKTSGLVSYTTKRVKVCSDTNPEARPGTDPCIYTYENQEYTNIADSLVMDVSYVPTANPNGATDQGQLSYQISCPSQAAANCGLCKGFQVGLEGAGGLAGEELQGVFAGASFITDALCALSGC